MARESGGYRLGVDLGTTFTAAAIDREDQRRMASLGVRQPEIPSVVAIIDDEVLVGDAAQRHAITRPESIAREFKRRIGDSTPLIVAGSPWSAEALTARLLAHVMQLVKESEGGSPDEVVVTHPANWREFKLDRLRQAMLLAGCEGARLMAEPVAAAQFYAADGRVSVGQRLAVFDFGGGTFDAAVLEAQPDGFRVIGEPKGLEQFGGIDLDHAVLSHVVMMAELDFDQLEATEENQRSVSRLRRDCSEAKENLSSDAATVIPVMLPGTHTEVRLTRAEFERMIRAPLMDSITVVESTIAAAGMQTTDIDAVLLVGGSSRIPLVAQMIGEQLARPVLSDAHPKHSVAAGAAASALVSRPHPPDIPRVDWPAPVVPEAPPFGSPPPGAVAEAGDTNAATAPIPEPVRPLAAEPAPSSSAEIPKATDEALDPPVAVAGEVIGGVGHGRLLLALFVLPFLFRIIDYGRTRGWAGIPMIPWDPDGWRSIVNVRVALVGLVLAGVAQLFLRVRSSKPVVDRAP